MIAVSKLFKPLSYFCFSVTFYKITVKPIELTWKTGHAALFVQLLQGLYFDSNDLGAHQYRNMMSLRIPQLNASVLLASSMERKNHWLEAANVLFDVNLDIYSSPMGHQAMTRKQLAFIEEQDKLTGRAKSLFNQLRQRAKGNSSSGTQNLLVLQYIAESLLRSFLPHEWSILATAFFAWYFYQYCNFWPTPSSSRSSRKTTILEIIHSCKPIRFRFRRRHFRGRSRCPTCVSFSGFLCNSFYSFVRSIKLQENTYLNPCTRIQRRWCDDVKWRRIGWRRPDRRWLCWRQLVWLGRWFYCFLWKLVLTLLVDTNEQGTASMLTFYSPIVRHYCANWSQSSDMWDEAYFTLTRVNSCTMCPGPV